MARQPDTPCTICGRLRYRNPSQDPTKLVCQDCRRARSEIPCRDCGAMFASRNGTVRCESCRGEPKPIGLPECVVCGSPNPPTRSRTCSAKCNGRDRDRRKVTACCVICGVSFTANDARRASACPDCVPVWTEMRRAEVQETDCVCHGCGVVFRAGTPWAKWCEMCSPYGPTVGWCEVCDTELPARRSRYCSDMCSAEAAIDRAGARINDLYALACRLDMSGWGWRKRLYAVLVERDGQNCSLCDGLVDLTVKSGPKGHDHGPSIDHVRPRSRGGTDDLENLRLCHWGCNRNKRDTWDGAVAV